MKCKRKKLQGIKSILSFSYENIVTEGAITLVYRSAYFWGCKKGLPKFDLAFPTNV